MRTIEKVSDVWHRLKFHFPGWARGATALHVNKCVARCSTGQSRRLPRGTCFCCASRAQAQDGRCSARTPLHSHGKRWVATAAFRRLVACVLASRRGVRTSAFLRTTSIGRLEAKLRHAGGQSARVYKTSARAATSRRTGRGSEGNGSGHWAFSRRVAWPRINLGSGGNIFPRCVRLVTGRRACVVAARAVEQGSHEQAGWRGNLMASKSHFRFV